jgi:hypothetical protein
MGQRVSRSRPAAQMAYIYGASLAFTIALGVVQQPSDWSDWWAAIPAPRRSPVCRPPPTAWAESSRSSAARRS